MEPKESPIPRIHLIRQKVIPFNPFTQDMAVMLKWLGINYEFVDTNEFMVRTSYVDTRYRMEIATRLNKAQKRFAIAHAIGHLVLHEIPSGIFTDKNFSKDTPLEREANLFACDLLVPLRMSEPIFRAFDGDDVKLAEFFQVPKDAIKIQIIKLLVGK
jgi:Zn-dependent peptidase ImmA (M78 family)